MNKFLKQLTLISTIIIVILLQVNVKAEEKDYSLKTSIYKTVAADPESIVQGGGRCTTIFT